MWDINLTSSQKQEPRVYGYNTEAGLGCQCRLSHLEWPWAGVAATPHPAAHLGEAATSVVWVEDHASPDASHQPL